MLRVELRALDDGPVRVSGVIPVGDPLFVDTDLRLAAPVEVEGTLSGAGPGQYYWRGRIGTMVQVECRRCLTTVSPPLTVPVEALFMEGADEAEADADVYPVPAHAQTLDLSSMVREEVLLAVPDFALCREDCRGLCDQCGRDLNDGPCGCAPAVDPRWNALRGLRTDDEGQGAE